MKYLIVDDELAVGEVLADLFDIHGINCDVVTDPLEALAVLKKSNYHTVICDVRMPKISGDRLFDLAKDLRGHGFSRWYFMTAFSEMNEVKAKAMGANGYLEKPFNSGVISQLCE